MTDGEQQPNGGTVAGVTTSTPAPNGSENPNETVAYWKQQAESWQARYNGQQTAMNKKVEEANLWKTKHADLSTEFETYKGTSGTELTEWQKKYQDLEKLNTEQTKKLSTFELKDKVFSLINTEFSELARDFSADPIYQAGILSAAQQMDDDGLKKALADSLALRKGQATAAADRMLQGATTPTPTSGTPSGLTEEQVLKKMNSIKDLNSPEFREMEDLLVDIQRKKTRT